MRVRNFFLEIREKVEAARKTKCYSVLELGGKREEMVADALRELKDEGLINTFLRTANLSWSDVMKGVDFYVIYISRTYKVCSLSVTGRGWIDEKKRRHPENQVIHVDLEETRESIKGKILRAIAAQERGWKS